MAFVVVVDGGLKLSGVGVSGWVCHQIKTFVLAGHETSASMLTWALYELMCSQQIMDKVGSSSCSFNTTGHGTAHAPPSWG